MFASDVAFGHIDSTSWPITVIKSVEMNAEPVLFTRDAVVYRRSGAAWFRII